MLRSINKQFDGVQALQDVSLVVERGTIHALVGENGAGKSTLGKIIGGAYRPTSGQVLVEGCPVVYSSPRDALADGIALISQEVALVPQRTVIDNVFLGIESARYGFLRGGEMREKYEELTGRSGFYVPPDTLVSSLRIAEQKKVEVLRAVARNARLIVMDEPTAALSAEETQRLFALVRGLKAKGTTIIYVSHFLEEVLSLADTVTVLRNGQLIKTSPVSVETPESLVEAMLGRVISLGFPGKVHPESGAPLVLSVEGLSRSGVFADISFGIRAGEIVGLAGLVGSGRSEVARAIFGADRRTAGVIRLRGEIARIRSPQEAIEAGVALLPESRKLQGLIMKFTAGHNVTLPHLRYVAVGPLVRSRVEYQRTQSLLADLDVRPPDPRKVVADLSGGNQQKVLFAKWLFNRPRVLIADEPTAGVDVGAKRAIYRLIHALAREGMAVLLISSDLGEVLGLAHRVLAMHRGQIVAEFRDPELTEERVMHAIFARDEGGASL